MIGRRAFLRVTAAGLVWSLAAGRRSALASPPAAAPDFSSGTADLFRALEGSEFVYVSPLRSDGRESRCHGEVWYGWLDRHVVLITATDRWKVTSVKRGLDRARIWVGDFGRWKRPLFTNERFRRAPSFEARAELSRDEALLERLLANYERKYPKHIGRWRDRMRSGFHDGSRVLVRYKPD